MQHSKLGIASVVFGAVSGALFLAGFFAIIYLEVGKKGDVANPGRYTTAAGFLICPTIPMSIAGTLLGLWGLAAEGKRRVLCIVGVAISAPQLLITTAVVLIGTILAV